MASNLRMSSKSTFSNHPISLLFAKIGAKSYSEMSTTGVSDFGRQTWDSAAHGVLAAVVSANCSILCSDVRSVNRTRLSAAERVASTHLSNSWNTCFFARVCNDCNVLFLPFRNAFSSAVSLELPSIAIRLARITDTQTE